MSSDPPPMPPPATPVTRRRLGAVTTMTWVVLALVPVLWVVELTGPEWLNLVLRALWVVLALGTVAGGVWVLARRRRTAGSGGARR